MTDFLSTIAPDAPPPARYAASQDAEKLIPSAPADQLTDIFSAAKDLMQEQAPSEARRAGFHVIAGLLGHTGLPEALRARCLQALIVPVKTDACESQFQTLLLAMDQLSDLSPVKEDVVDYTLQRIMPQFEAQNAARKRVRSEHRGGAAKEVPTEERGMHQMLEFLVELISQQSDLFSELKLTELFDLILAVVEKASATGTVERVCQIIRSVTMHSFIPSKSLRRCLEDLCAIYNTTQRLKDLTWECLELLLKSERQDENEIVDIVLETIGIPPQERQAHTVCGAIRTARFLVTSQGKPHIPQLDFERLLEAISEVNFSSRRIRKEVLRTVCILLTDTSTTALAIETDDWQPLLAVINRAIEEKWSGARSRHSINTVGSDDHDPSDANEPSTNLAEAEEVLLDQVTHIAAAFAKLWPRASSNQHQHMQSFFLKFETILPRDFLVNMIAGQALDGYYDGATSVQHDRLDELVELFALDHMNTCEQRCAVIQVLKKLLAESPQGVSQDHLHTLVLRLLSDFEARKDLIVGNDLADLVVVLSKTSNLTDGQIHQALDLIWPLLNVQHDTSDALNTSCTSDSGFGRGNTVTRSLVELFLHSMGQKPTTAARVYNHLVSISNACHLSSSTQLAAIQFLMLLRCDLDHQVHLITFPDVQGLAAVLCRTDVSIVDRSSVLSSRHHSMAPDEKAETRQTRVSGFSAKTQSTIRSSNSAPLRVKETQELPPRLWVYSEKMQWPTAPPSTPSESLHIYSTGMPKGSSIHLGDWLANAISIIQQPSTDWELLSYVLVHLPAQLSNRELFSSSLPHVRMLRRILVDQLLTGNIYEPPRDSGVRKGDVALCLYHSLTMLIGYSDKAEREEQERIVQAFVDGVTKWERTGRFCIQSLSICCLVLPAALTNWLSAVLQRMSQMITQSHLAVDILEFLATLSRHRKIYVNFREEEYRTVFAICIRYLEHSREQRLRLLTPGDRATSASAAQSQSKGEKKPGVKPDLYEDLPQYVFALAYNVLTVWFLAVKVGDRNDHVGWITRNLAWKDPSGGEIMEEQSQVTLDMMMRTAYLNLGETAMPQPFDSRDGKILSKTWLLGLSIVTIDTGTATGVSRVTKRQASGTTYAIYRPQTVELPPHHEASPEEERGSDMGANIYPNHVLLQLTSSIAPTPSPMEAICLPEDDQVRRALTTFDRNDTVDGFKVGVVYVGNDQTTEREILGNAVGSPAFRSFLEGLGTKVALRGASFNTQGLDKVSDSDGTHTFAWRDRVTEMIFHVPTMMPTDLENDPHHINKKRHIGNDYVKIIWNESGHPFDFDTIASQFNCVNIVIVPDALLVPSRRTVEPNFEKLKQDQEPFYTIQVKTTDSFPELSPVASYKLLPLGALPILARELALQASVFSNVWMNRETGEHASSWRNRLREIKRLRERYANTGTSTSEKYPGAKSRTSYQTGDEFQGRVAMGGLTEYGEDLAASLDFSRWAGPNGNHSRH